MISPASQSRKLQTYYYYMHNYLTGSTTTSTYPSSKHASMWTASNYLVGSLLVVVTIIHYQLSHGSFTKTYSTTAAGWSGKPAQLMTTMYDHGWTLQQYRRFTYQCHNQLGALSTVTDLPHYHSRPRTTTNPALHHPVCNIYCWPCQQHNYSRHTTIEGFHRPICWALLACLSRSPATNIQNNHDLDWLSGDIYSSLSVFPLLIMNVYSQLATTTNVR